MSGIDNTSGFSRNAEGCLENICVADNIDYFAQVRKKLVKLFYFLRRNSILILYLFRYYTYLDTFEYYLK